MRASLVPLLGVLLGLAACQSGGRDWLPPADARLAIWEDWRAAKDSLFLTEDSPLPEDARATFDGLSYFHFDSTLAFAVPLEPVLSADTLRMPTTTGQVRHYVRYGRFTFYVGGRVQHLTAYRAIDRPEGHGSVFVPFTDATNRSHSYGGGRYIDLQADPEGRYVLDFNFAYSPYCAYDPRWSCPIPPSENRLAIPIAAGERYEGDRG